MHGLRNLAFLAAAAGEPAGPTPGDTGWLLPSTSDDTGVDWANPSNAFAVDAASATADAAAESDSTQIHVQGYGASIPEGATIVGIEVEITRAADANDCLKDSDFHLESTGVALRSDNFADGGAYLPNMLAARTYGSSTTMPDGTTSFPTRAQIVASNFGVRYAAHNDDTGGTHALSVDCIRLKIHYTT